VLKDLISQRLNAIAFRGERSFRGRLRVADGRSLDAATPFQFLRAASLPVTPVAPRMSTFSPCASFALAERKQSGHAGVRKRRGRRVIESIRHREAKRSWNHSTLGHRAVWTARPAKENPGAIGEAANTVRSTDHRQFTWTGEMRAGGKLLVQFSDAGRTSMLASSLPAEGSGKSSERGGLPNACHTAACIGPHALVKESRLDWLIRPYLGRIMPRFAKRRCSAGP
jgi:hypothetical protein